MNVMSFGQKRLELLNKKGVIETIYLDLKKKRNRLTKIAESVHTKSQNGFGLVFALK